MTAGASAAPVEHDPSAFASELAGQQASSERRLRALIGAGASQSAGLPGLGELGTRVLATVAPTYGDAAKNLFVGRNLEQALTRLRRILSLLETGEAFADLDTTTGRALESAITDAIVTEVGRVPVTTNPYQGLARWLARQERRHPLELFTLNYDTLLEAALEETGAAYFDGFVGVFNGAFRADLVDGATPRTELPSFVGRLWKLHGSINWKVDASSGTRRITRLGQSAAGSVAAIYPSEEKYEASRRTPFLVLHDRFRRAISEPESLLIVSGYSFSDQHLNEVIYDASLLNARSQVTVFCHHTIPTELASRAEATPNLTVVSESEAIWGGVRGPWQRVDIDGIAGGGKLLLSDFPKLAEFLARAAVGD